MKATELRSLTPDQLDDKLVELKKEQFNLRFQAVSGQLENTARVRQVRRQIACIMTIARQAKGGVIVSRKAGARTAATKTGA